MRDATDYWTVFGLVKRMDFGFELGRGLVAERGMFPVMVIVGINVIENLGAGVGLIEEAAVLRHLAFKGAHE